MAGLLGVDLGAAAAGAALAEEQERRVGRGQEPQDHVREVDPDGVLHADLAVLLRGRARGDEDAAEEAEEGRPEDAVRRKKKSAFP